MNRYGFDWNVNDEALIEAALYRAGGYMEVGGRKVGEGKLYHFKRLISLLMPWFAFHTYSNLIVEAWVNHDMIGVAGPASTSKTYTSAACAYAEFFCRPHGTSIIMSSIDLKGLKLRVWGSIVEIVNRIKERRPAAPGYIVPSEIRIYAQEPTDEVKNDPRDAILGVACKVGDQYVGIGCFPAGTPVTTPNGPVAIESIKPGDRVLNREGKGIVEATISRLADSFVRVTLDEKIEIECTPNHEFLAAEPKEWLKANRLEPGRRVCCCDFERDRMEVTKIERYKSPVRLVYDLQVSNDPSYFVHNVIVHNSYVGVKNDQIIGVFDELSLSGAGFWDSISNLKKNPRTKFIGLGNPKDHYDALGKICEPEHGWDSLPHSEHSRTWRTRGGGIAVQLSGLDTPNGTGADGRPCAGLNRFPYLITPEQIEEDKRWYGTDSWQFQMMDLGVFPRGASSRRVITRDICEKGNAFGEPNWDGVTKTQDYIGVDAAYSGIGGDRTPLIHIRTGKDINGLGICAIIAGPILIPVDVNVLDADGRPIPAEQQIAQFMMDYCQKNRIPPSHAGYDSTGRGTLVHALAMLWSTETVPIEFGGLPPDDRLVLSHDKRTEREAYGKMVSALWFAVRNLIVQGQLRGLPMSVFEEGTLREYVVTKSGKEDVEPKDATKKRLGRSPDLMDALVAGLECARRNGFSIGRPEQERIPGLPSWLEKKRKSWRVVRREEVLA